MFEHTAVEMYSRARDRAQWGRVRSVLSGRPRRLIDLVEASVACTGFSKQVNVWSAADRWCSDFCVWDIARVKSLAVPLSGTPYVK
jgi:hypothetical protein